MANRKISELTAVTSLTGSETVPVVQSGTTKKATVAQLIGGGFAGLNDAATIVWDYTTGKKKYVTLTGNRTLSVTNTADGDTGILLVYQDVTGGRTLAFPGNVPAGVSIANSTSSVTMCTFINRGGVLFWDLALYGTVSAPSGDTTAPTFVSAATSGASGGNSFITVQFSENMGAASSAGWTIKVNGGAATITNVQLSANIMYVFTISTTLLSTDVITISYNPTTGNTIDSAGNELATITDQPVTNNVSGGATLATANRIGYWKETDMVKSGGKVTSWPEVGSASSKTWTAVSTIEPDDAGVDGLLSNDPDQMTLPAPVTVGTAFSMYAWIKRTGDGILLSAGSGSYWLYMHSAGVGVKPNSTTGSATSTSIVPLNTWAVVCLTYSGVDGEFPKLYIDGTLAATLSGGNMYFSGGYNIANLLGHNSALNLAAYLKRVAVYSVAHTASEVSTNSTALIA